MAYFKDTRIIPVFWWDYARFIRSNCNVNVICRVRSHSAFQSEFQENSENLTSLNLLSICCDV